MSHAFKISNQIRFYLHVQAKSNQSIHGECVKSSKSSLPNRLGHKNNLLDGFFWKNLVMILSRLNLQGFCEVFARPNRQKVRYK